MQWQPPADDSIAVVNYFVSIWSAADDGASFSYINETVDGFVTVFDTRDTRWCRRARLSTSPSLSSTRQRL